MSSVNKPKMKIQKVDEVISIQPDEVGSIKHYVSIKSGRCTFMSNEYSKETTNPHLNSAATYKEVEQMRDVFNTLLEIMKKGMPGEPRAKKVKHPCGKRGFLITLPDGKEISVLDFADLMKSAPKAVRKSGCYLGWEAWDGKETFRAETFEEVEAMLRKKYTLNYA